MGVTGAGGLRSIGESGVRQQATVQKADPEKIHFEDIEFTREVPPGGRVAVSWIIFVEEFYVDDQFDPDFCFTKNLQSGVKLILEITFAGTQIGTREVCWGVQTRDRRAKFDFLEPTVSEGTYTMEIIARRQSDGEIVEQSNRAVVVTQDAQGCPDTPCPEGMTCQDGQCTAFGGDGPIQTLSQSVPFAVAGGITGVGVGAQLGSRPLPSGLVGAGLGVGTKAWLDQANVQVPWTAVGAVALLGAGAFVLHRSGGLPGREQVERRARRRLPSG